MVVWRVLVHSGNLRPLAARLAAAGGRALSINEVGADALHVAIPLWRVICIRTYADQQSDPPRRGAWPADYSNVRIQETDTGNLYGEHSFISCRTGGGTRRLSGDRQRP